MEVKVYARFVDHEKATYFWEKQTIMLKKYRIMGKEKKLIKEICLNQIKDTEIASGVRLDCYLSSTSVVEEIVVERFDVTRGVSKKVECIRFADGVIT